MGTDGQGEFHFDGIATGKFRLRVKQGLLGAARRGDLPRDGDIARPDVMLDAKDRYPP